MSFSLRSLRNTVGWIGKIGFLPIVIHFLPDLGIQGFENTFTLILSYACILVGLMGLLHADMLVLRFGDGNLHFSSTPTRLVDVSLYARNRHPFAWFYALYQYGILLLVFGFSPILLFVSILVSILTLLWLQVVQDRQLMIGLGKQYREYLQQTPLWSWKLSIPENLRVGFRPQALWIVGMTIIRRWYGINARGIHNIPHKRPFIIVANHECYLDPFLFGIFIPHEIKFVTTADVFTTPLTRFLLKGTGSFPMHRHKQDLKSIRTMIRMINQGQVVCIFPEGGRSTDGAPLPILKETLKLIQRCKVPILPIHLDGAYEIWPRWAPNRRHGKVSVTFGDVIPVADQQDLTSLETHIRSRIFTPDKVFRSVRSRRITTGMENLLWACYKCRSRNSIEVTTNRSITCKTCNSQWHVENNYSYLDISTKRSLNSIEWIKEISIDILDYPQISDFSIEYLSDEQLHLQSTIDGYQTAEDFRDQQLNLLLTNQRLLLMESGKLFHQWPLDVITIFTMDYYNAVSIGVGGVRHTFKLPPEEISLKWQTYFDTLQAKMNQLD